MEIKNQKDILLSVCMVTYNHENWIDKAIEGVLMQNTSFKIELVIREDCSTDSTWDIIQSYAINNPDIIRAYRSSFNLGLAKNFSGLLNECKGKYIAICEGDDYWTDSCKLQKQVEFLESKSDVVMTSHNYTRLYDSENKELSTAKYSTCQYYDQKRFLEEWITQPVTCVFRNIFRDYTFLNKEDDIFCDVIMYYELLKHGKGYFMPDNMAVFRIQEKALSSCLSEWQWSMNHIIMFDYLYKHNNRDQLLQSISRHHCLILYTLSLKDNNKNNDFKPLKEYFKRAPGTKERLLTTFLRVPYYILKFKILKS